MVAAVLAILNFFEAVERLKANTQPLAHLPNDVRARVLRRMIKRRVLAGGVVEVYIPVSQGRTKFLAPFVGVTDHGAPIGKCIQAAIASKSSITICESRIITETADTVPVHAEHLRCIIGSQIEPAPEIYAPSEDMMILAQTVFCSDV